MLTDKQIANRLNDMIAAIEAPAPPVSELLARASRVEEPQLSYSANSIRGMAVAAAIVLALILTAMPIVAPGIVQTLQARLTQLVQWTPPPRAPKSVDSAIVSHTVNLRQAQRLVRFQIVPPTGLPRDAVLESIVATPVAVYSNVTHSWSVGPPSLTFSYRRAGGRKFALRAEDYDPRTGPPPKYIFDADEIGPNGLPKRYRNFAWRNGDQEISILEDANIDSSEISAIRTAMHGTPLHLATTRAELNAGSIVKRYAAP